MLETMAEEIRDLLRGLLHSEPTVKVTGNGIKLNFREAQMLLALARAGNSH